MFFLFPCQLNHLTFTSLSLSVPCIYFFSPFTPSLLSRLFICFLSLPLYLCLFYLYRSFLLSLSIISHSPSLFHLILLFFLFLYLPHLSRSSFPHTLLPPAERKGNKQRNRRRKTNSRFELTGSCVVSRAATNERRLFSSTSCDWMAGLCVMKSRTRALRI